MVIPGKRIINHVTSYCLVFNMINKLEVLFAMAMLEIKLEFVSNVHVQVMGVVLVCYVWIIRFVAE